MRARSVLAVFAHPDDEVLCAAGTLALCVERGDKVSLLCATRGEFGPIASPTLATPESLPIVRERELRASCAALGIDRVELLGLPDSGIDWAAKERGTLASLVRLIRELCPDAIITFGPDGLYGHPDHAAVSELICAARALAADPLHLVSRHAVLEPFHVPRLFFPVWTHDFVRELLEAVSLSAVPVQLWGLQPEHFLLRKDAVTTSVDVTSVLEQKLEAIRCHKTQMTEDNALMLLSTAERDSACGQILHDLARRFLGVEHFRCADGLPGTPVRA